MHRLFLTPFIFLGALFAANAHGALAPLADSELAEIRGQAILEVVTLTDPGNTNNNDIPTKFMRIRTGAKVKLSANIDRLVAGEYKRDDKWTSYSSAFGTHTTTNHAPNEGFIKGYRNPLFHDKIYVSGGGCEAKAGLTGFHDNGCYIPGSDLTATGADVIIENLSMGAVINNRIDPMIMEDPYIEIAFADADTQGYKKGDIIGLRFGAENQVGHLGNYSTKGVGNDGVCGVGDTLCGEDNTGKQRKRDGGVLSFSGNLNLIAGSTFLIGYSVIEGVARTNYTPVKGGLISGILAGNATQTLADINHTGTREFFLSFAAKEIQYPSISNNFEAMKVNKNLIKTIPGVSINMVDGIALTFPQALGTLSAGIPKFSNCFDGAHGACHATGN